MTLVNYEFYLAMLEAGATKEQATAASAAVLHRPFTAKDAAVIRQAFIDVGCPVEKAEAAAQSLLEALW